MTSETRSAAAASLLRPPVWVRRAFVKTVAGLVLGLMTATVMVWLSNRAFPGLQEFGEDLGLRLGAALARVQATVPAISSLNGGDLSYVFLDVDPERFDPAQEGACAALVGAARDRRAGKRLPTGMVLQCSSARPVNRYLISELVEGLRARGARLIVLDIVLAQEPQVVDPGEDEALRKTLAANEPTVPLVFVAPYDVPIPTTEGARVVAALPALVSDNAVRGVHGAVAIPAPGQPLRRYPKCFLPVGAGNARLASLPYLAAQYLRGSGTNPCARGRDVGQNSPRIVFTLPSMAGHQDDVNDAMRIRWAAYRHLYNRCLAAQFWNTSQSHCGRAEAYAGKVVVIGVSNPLRRDRHYTPLGDMAGSEVVINAMRSFVAYPEQRDRSFLELLKKKLTIVGWCGLIWLGYFVVRCRPIEAKSSAWRHATHIGITGIAFAVALVSVVALALLASFRMEGPVPSIDVLVPVLAIAIDEYVEQASKLIHKAEAALGSMWGLPAEHEKGHRQ